jgi:fructose-1-phosphate kinase PfkB-like protein
MARIRASSHQWVIQPNIDPMSAWPRRPRKATHESRTAADARLHAQIAKVLLVGEAEVA